MSYCNLQLILNVKKNKMIQKTNPFLWLGLVLFGLNFTVFGQRNSNNVKDTLSGNAFIRMVDQSLSMYINEYLSKSGSADSILAALDYEPREIPQFSTDVICKRLEKMNTTSDFGFDCNEVSLAMIRFFAANRRNFIKVVLGRSALYFDLFEEKLNDYGLPKELRFLSVIESGLRPQVKSRAGALGLWQFMYGTGKMYGLVENSYLDERMDPAKATDAACRYLKKLNEIYGDWNLALAAYNAGPGNVNKAIRRSGGKRTYWEVRPFLPRETQGYVPNFIAASYLITYAKEHNLNPIDVKTHYYQLDTMCLKRGVHMTTIERLVDWPITSIRELNPVYKTAYIPPTYPPQCISGPLDKIGLLVSVEEQLYSTEYANYGNGDRVITTAEPIETSEQADPINASSEETIVEEPQIVYVEVPKTKEITTVKYTYHRVKSGESLGKIAAQYSVSIQDIMEWNQLNDTRVNSGQMLKIQSNITTTIDNPEYVEPSLTQMQKPIQNTAQQQVQQTVSNESVEDESVVESITEQKEVKRKETAQRKKYHTIRRGETFSTIADKYGLTMRELKRMNPGTSISRIQAGERLRVR